MQFVQGGDKSGTVIRMLTDGYLPIYKNTRMFNGLCEINEDQYF